MVAGRPKQVCGRRLWWFLSLALSLLCVASSAHSADSRVAIEVSPEEGSRNSQFIMDVRLEGVASSASPNIESSTEFDVQYIGPSTEVNIQNGRTSVSKTLSYILRPKKEGKLQTPKVSIVLPTGERLTPSPKQVIVHASTGTGGFSKTPSNDSTRRANEYFELDQAVSDTEVYVGEQLVLKRDFTYSISPGRITAPEVIIDDVWSVSFPDAKENRTRLRGRSAMRKETRHALFPLRSGTLAIPPADVEVSYRSPGRSRDPRERFFGGPLFGDFFQFGKTATASLRSESAEVTVKPLPQVPDGYSDQNRVLVGDVSVTLDIDRTDLNPNETAELSITIESDGNLDSWSELKFPKLKELLKVYPETPSSRTFIRAGRLFTEKTFRYSLVPYRNGRLEYPGFSIEYFNPRTERYQRARSLGFNLRVTGFSNAAEPQTDTQLNSPEKPMVDQPAVTSPAPVVDYYPEQLGFAKFLTPQVAVISASLATVLLTLAYFALLMFKANYRQRAVIRELQHAETPKSLLESVRSNMLKLEHLRAEESLYSGTMDEIRNRIPQGELRLRALDLYSQLESLVFSDDKGSDVQSRFRAARAEAIALFRALKSSL